MKYFSFKVWFFTSLAMMVGATALWSATHLLRWVFGSCTEGVIWIIAHSGNFKRAFISLCIVVAVFYGVRIVRAITLFLEAKARKEQGL